MKKGLDPLPLRQMFPFILDIELCAWSLSHLNPDEYSL